MKLYFVRHGESEANLLQVISNRGLKHGLTPQGREQASTLAQALMDANVAKVFSSPLLRALQTAEILSDSLGVPFETTGTLREFDCGVLEEKSDAASWDAYRAVWRDWMEHERWERRIEEGESFLEIKARFVPFVDQLLEEYRASMAAILLVGHGGLFQSMLPLVLANVDARFSLAHPVSNTGYIVAKPSPGGLICLSWCGISVVQLPT